MNKRHLVVLCVLAVLSACGGGMQVGGGPAPDSMTGQMLAPNPSDTDPLNDSDGTAIPE